jgi:hypothetical protein
MEGASVAKWLRLLTSNHLPLTAVGLNPYRDFGFFHVRKLPASLRNVSGSARVPICAWNNAGKGTWGLPPPVKLERRDMTYTVLMWRKTKNKQTNTKMVKMGKISIQYGISKSDVWKGTYNFGFNFIIVTFNKFHKKQK